MKYYKIGQLMSMNLLQGGSGFPYLAPPVYQYISGVELSALDVSVEDVANFELQSMIKEVQLYCLMSCANVMMVVQHWFILVNF